MDNPALFVLLNSLIQKWENEIIEFKQASTDFETGKIGRYFSALSNEANLRGAEKAWLIFGVCDKSRDIVGTSYREKSSEQLQKTKQQIADGTEPRITFRNIYEPFHQNGRVVLFEIPAAPQGMPISWNGHYYARAGESLNGLGLDKQDEIRQQTKATDWSAQSIPTATMDHLDPKALKKARDSFLQKYSSRFQAEEINQWSDRAFLDRARLTQDGQLTRTAILLLGKPEASYLLSPHPAQMTWKLEGPEEKAYEHFGPPFLLNTSALYHKIRNVQIRILTDNELPMLPAEISKYEQRVILEALHNCIAHQDFTRNSRIVVTEFSDRLIFENEGAFFEGTPEDYIIRDKTPRRYRNPFLTQAMAELNMIDTIGYGIHSIHREQVRRFLPMPDFDLSEPYAVKLIVYGKIVDPAYTKLLTQNTNLPLEQILALDRVQKKLPINDAMIKILKRDKLIEGRKPNFHISASIAQSTAHKAEYIQTKAQDDSFYAQLVMDYIQKFGKASRTEIDRLLLGKLGDVLGKEQKKRKIANLLTKMRRAQQIQNQGPKKAPIWVLFPHHS